MSKKFNIMVSQMGFNKIEQENERIYIKKTCCIYEIVIVFNTKEKYLHGLLIPFSVIKSDDDIVKIREGFEKMKIFLKTFKELSNYNILNKIN